MLLLALGSGLVACGPAAPGRTSGAVAASRGQSLFEGNCIACHQGNARGIPGVYPSLVGSSVVLGDPGAFALWVVKGRRPPSLSAGSYSTQMPQFGWMQDADVAALLAYLRSNFGNAGLPVDAAAIAKALGD